MSNYPTSYYYGIIIGQDNLESKFDKNGGNLTQVSYDESVAMINVYLDDLVYSEVEETPEITVDGVLGTIGKVNNK